MQSSAILPKKPMTAIKSNSLAKVPEPEVACDCMETWGLRLHKISFQGSQ
jgi:hypothetical protein